MQEARVHILVAILDWGLGHATRSIPIIRLLQRRNYKISIAGNGQSLSLLKQEFPDLMFNELISYRVTYPAAGWLLTTILFQLPKFLAAIRKEHQQIEKIVSTQKVDFIISDNRYGCYSKRVPSVFITHQLTILLPAPLKAIANYFNHQFITNFRICWVPDDPQHRFSGKLSDSKRLTITYIGMLSRFQPKDEIEDPELMLGLISGPEEQRTNFEVVLTGAFASWTGKSVIIRGIPKGSDKAHPQITFINHLPGSELNRVVQQAGIIVARSGYSTVMDLCRLGKKKVIFIPTPGQPEQEYLATELDRKKIALRVAQDQFNLPQAIQALKTYTGFEAINSQPNLLEGALDELVQLKQE